MFSIADVESAKRAPSSRAPIDAQAESLDECEPSATINSPTIDYNYGWPESVVRLVCVGAKVSGDF